MSSISVAGPALSKRNAQVKGANQEWRFLLAACGPDSSGASEVGSLFKCPPRWDSLFELAEHHGVLPLLHRALTPFRDSVPAADLATLNSKHRANLHKAMMLSRELINIVGALAEGGIEVMPYKGLALAESLYGDIALRQTGDIDLLIRAKDVSRARDVLRNLHFVPHLALPERQESAYLQSGYEYMFDAPAGRNLLELQWAAQPSFYAVDLRAEELFERAVPVSVAGRTLKTPSFEDLFIVLSLHAAKHVWAKLIWISDLARIIKLERLDWDQVGSLARHFRIRRILTMNLLLANRLLGVGIPSAAEPLVESGNEALAETIEGFMTTGVPFHPESLAYFRFMLQLRENPADRARFLTRLALTPGPGEWNSLRVPDLLFPLYRLVRLSRLIARVGHR
ncbi:MAG TPA: nucleotidyltransferase family protein [Candidatus Eisenbacteria bacterium]|nr:nucleotidyltransferase family protein [Candidatus Eisenbacteria bacterium]